MKLLFSYLGRHKKILFGTLLLAAINQGFSLIDPQIFRLIIDNYASRALELPKETFVTGVLLLLLASIGIVFVSRVAKNFQEYYLSVITQRVGTRLYAESVEHSFSLPYSVFEEERSGALLQKFQKARIDSQALISSFINVIFLSFVGIVFVLTYSFIVHPFIGLLYFLIIPILGTMTFLIGRKIKLVQKKIVREGAELAGSTTETLRNVELVKSLGLENQEITRLNSVNEKILSLELQKIKLIRYLSFTQGTMVNAMRAGLLFLMLYLVFASKVTLGEFFSLLFYSFFIFTPLGELGTVAAQYQEARASLEELENVLKIPREAKPKDALEIQAVETIDFQNVGFSYRERAAHSLQEVNFTIKAGETVAFVGPSGSGKSTLIKLIVGLYKSNAGTILFNGQNAEKIDYEKLRRRIGLVLQETQLFAGTIRENLLFVNPGANDADCLKVLKEAAVSSILERGGKGLDSKIGEGGLKLSGGERQRLAIARALLRKPEIIIFDEATSSLDSITEKEIVKTIQSVEKLKPNLINILVAHRLSTVSHAKRIYVLEKGKIVESGSHAELIRKNGLYAALAREQAAGGSNGENSQR